MFFLYEKKYFFSSFFTNKEKKRKENLERGKVWNLDPICRGIPSIYNLFRLPILFIYIVQANKQQIVKWVQYFF
jgi:hypothetical protein